MSNVLRQSTAAQSRSIGPFLDSTDFFTPKTGLTIANTDIKLLPNGGASANKNSGGGTHRINGHYGITFDATDTATVGELEVSSVIATALPVFKTFFVMSQAAYDQLYGSAAPGAATVAALAAVDTKVTNNGTAIAAVQSDTDNIQTRIPAALVGGKMDSTDSVSQAAIAVVNADTDNIQTRLPAALVGGRMDSNVGSKTAAISQADADEFLNRNLAGGASGGSRNVRNALRSLRNRVVLTELTPTTGTVDVYDETDAVIAWSGAVTKAAGNPLTSIDPA